MPKKAVLLKSLTRGRIRASFNKYNLFNLYKKGKIDFRTKTLYQQKFHAKQETRAYHGEHLTEGRFNTLFSSKLNSVAQLDASLRKSGGSADNKLKETPYILQTYATLEKRLEFALFRAMFASSIRQARQFILHGNVFVNGIKMRHPGYPLKPGDIFHVKQDKVLEALGAKKPSLEESLKIDKIQIEEWNQYVKDAKENPKKAWDEKMAKFKNQNASYEDKKEFNEFIQQYRSNLEKEEHRELESSTNKNLLNQILKLHYNKLKDTQSELNNSEKEQNITPLTLKDIQQLVNKDTTDKLAHNLMKSYQDLIKSGLIRWDKISPLIKDKENGDYENILREYSEKLCSLPKGFRETLSDNEKSLIRSANKTLAEVANKYSLQLSTYYRQLINEVNSENIPYDPKWVDQLEFHPEVDFDKLKENERKEMKAIQLPWQKGHTYGRKDISKPYFTPWKPRQFLAPFAILPNHLEISFKTCSAIYLRDPIARPGQSEVISPFALNVHERAYMFYVRKGK